VDPEAAPRDLADGGADPGRSQPQFEVFYRDRWQPTVRLARMIVGSQDEAEEIAQEAFIRLHERWLSIDRPDGFLYTATVNLCRSLLRRRATARRKSIPDPLSIVCEPEIDETWLALNRLPFRQRAVLALAYYADLPEAEIAELLGCRIGTVKSARHRALRALKRGLS
jgi:RNA polymerase sigma factor (sigma-70 family)